MLCQCQLVALHPYSRIIPLDKKSTQQQLACLVCPLVSTPCSSTSTSLADQAVKTFPDVRCLDEIWAGLKILECHTHCL